MILTGLNYLKYLGVYEYKRYGDNVRDLFIDIYSTTNNVYILVFY